MIAPQPARWLNKKTLSIGGVTAAVALFFLVSMPTSTPVLHGDVPLPFGTNGSNIAGRVTFLTQRNGIDVFDVTFNNSEVSETMHADRIYLVHIPHNRQDIANIPLDVAITTVGTHLRNVNYYGYKYSDASATLERRDIAAVRFADRFPGKFFASAKARSEDTAFGNGLAQFEQANGVSFLGTGTGTGSVRLDPTGSLYVFVVNEPQGAYLSVRSSGVCGDTQLNIGEDCDDGNQNDLDACTNMCQVGIPIPFDPSTHTGSKFGIAVQTIATQGFVTRGQQGVRMMRLDAGAQDDVRFFTLKLALETGSFLNADNYSLWMDGDGDGYVETVLQEHAVATSNLLIFDRLGGTADGLLLPKNSAKTFEVIANITENAPTKIMQLRLATEQTGFIEVRGATSTLALSGIRTNGVCAVGVCQMNVLTTPSVKYTIRDSLPVPNACGNSAVDPHGADGISGNADDEQCDDGNTTNGDKCSALCKYEVYPIQLHGRLVDKLTGAAISGAVLHSEQEYTPAVVKTDSDGNFSFSVKTDFKLTAGPNAGQSNAFGQWSFFKDCYQHASVTLQRTSTEIMKLSKSFFDSNDVTTDIGLNDNITLDDFTVYPSVHIAATTDFVSVMSVVYSYKNLTGFGGAGTLTSALSHFIASVLPADYNVQLHFTKPDNTTLISDEFHVPADAVCKTILVHQSATETHVSICGNGATEESEQCDDGNSVNGDGCTSMCLVESNFTCTGTPSVCTQVVAAVCGDNAMTGTETCDDGDTDSDDGCSATCAIESGYVCTGTPSACTTTTEAPVCGNNVIEFGEQCDDADTDSGDGCSATCSIESNYLCTGNPSVCTQVVTGPVCGNGVITNPETCDDGDATSGDGCSSTCAIESNYTCTGAPSICTTTGVGAVCGNGVISGTEACDDGDLDNEDGCSSTCTIENAYTCTGTPSVCTLQTNVPVCGNGVVSGSETCDDGDTDSGDGCSSMCVLESGYSCTGTPSVCTTIVNGPVCGNGVITGTEQCDDGDASSGDGCSSTCAIESNYTCTGVPSLCTQITTGPVCGNGVITSPETCDDGDADSGDGCSATCIVENTYTCTGTPSVCTQTVVNPVCGNGLVQNGEGCDDGNTTNGDGCNATCTAEVGFQCGGQPSVCTSIVVPFCGNGIVTNTETCDDNNSTSGDGCSSTCSIENNYTCTGTPSVCTQTVVNPVCGNGVISGTETCDDGNTSNADGCSSTCNVENNFTCTGVPSLCEEMDLPVCGNSIISGTENCDDGNTANGDGCSAACTTESGYTCTGLPSMCTTGGSGAVCGNGVKESPETCDDGGTTSGDGCSATCTLESNFVCTDGVSSPTTCTSYLDYVRALADTNTNGTVSENEALILTLNIVEAPDQPYNTVSQYDMNRDGDVDNSDVAIILGQLDILAP